MERFEEELGPYTIEDVRALPEGQRAELIHGFLYPMETPDVIHQELVGELSAEIRDHLRSQKGAGRAYLAPLPVFLDAQKTKKEWVEPDVFVVCDRDKVHEDGLYGAPDWVIEIASASSLIKDLLKKPVLYHLYGVKEYWCINPMDQSLLVWLFSPDLSISKHAFDEEVHPSLFPAFTVKGRNLLPS